MFTGPHKDDIALLKEDRAFVMKMEDGEKIVGKMEKELDLSSLKQRNLHLHLKGDTLHDTAAHALFNTIVRDSYYEGKELKFLALTKLELTKD